jgi:hypothetical protein
MPAKKQRLLLLAILLLAVLLRVGVALYLGDTVPVGKDEQSYSELAARLAAGHGYSFDRPWYPFALANTPTAHWSFLYTAFVAAVYRAVGPHPLAPRLLQAVLAGLLLPWLTYRLARRAGVRGQGSGIRRQGSGVRGQGAHRDASRSGVERQAVDTMPGPQLPTPNPQPSVSVPLLAAFLAAIYAYFILYGGMVQTEAFYICALLWSLERALALGENLRLRSRSRPSENPGLNLNLSLTLGLSLGVATLLRQSILPWAAVLFAWLLWQGYRGGNLRRALASTLTSALVLALCILPFTLRNYRVYGDFLLLNSNAGYAMYSAQHPLHGTSFQEYTAAPLPEDLVDQGLNEAQWDKALMARGIGFVLAEPGRYLLLSLSRVRDFFEFWPTADSSLIFNAGRVLSIALFLPFMLYGIWVEVKAKVEAKAKAKVKAKAEAEVEVGVEVGAEDMAPAGYFSTSALTLTLTFVLFYSVLHILTWAMSRYRLPVDAVLLIFATVAIADPLTRRHVRTLER